jgi:hypothetical protein
MIDFCCGVPKPKCLGDFIEHWEHTFYSQNYLTWNKNGFLPIHTFLVSSWGGHFHFILNGMQKKKWYNLLNFSFYKCQLNRFP